MQFAPPRRGNRLIINVTSLIDVMFLLLIFFLVTSTFKHQPAIELELPSSTSAEPVMAGPAVLYLTSDGAIYLEDRRLGEDEIVSALRQRLAEGGENNIVLRSDTHTEFGRVVRLMDMIKESGFSRVSMSARAAGGADTGG
ncbi:biopolymer transporter ExbD, partial [bacterium]|nr:biopolymer transporter ExbD [bacterium]